MLDTVLEFWFGKPGDPGYGEARESWFKSTPELDAETRERFGALYEDVAAGKLDGSMDTPNGCLALILVLDQFPRNIFRGSAKAFATDAKALAISKHAIDKRFDVGMTEHEKTFLYMPFQHSEDLADHQRSVEIFSTLETKETFEFAKAHRAVIEQFGRYPHRNKVLGRTNTPAEEEYLKDADSWGQ